MDLVRRKYWVDLGASVLPEKTVCDWDSRKWIIQLILMT